MYELSDTIGAVSSPSTDGRVIIRLTGPGAIGEAGRIFKSSFDIGDSGIIRGFVSVDEGLKVEAHLYLFLSPHSYTGEDVAEIHIQANTSVTEALMYKLLAGGVRMAGPGEFTARSYLNGKMDLSQAEAVNEIVVSSNRIQLLAAEQLLVGRLAEAVEGINSQLLDCLSLIEAGLDFSEEDVEFISRYEAVERLSCIRGELEGLLAGSVSYEAMIDLPSVGVAGAPNAGKSLLVNRLLGRERSIVSGCGRTTRDILTSQLSLEHSRCVLFDCAGLLSNVGSIIDSLSQQAAIEALGRSDVVVFCVDLSESDMQLTEDVTIRRLISTNVLIGAVTKVDLIKSELVDKHLGRLREFFGCDFIVTSAKTSFGIDDLREAIDKKLLESMAVGGQIRESIGLTARHRQLLTEAIGGIGQAIKELGSGADEVSAMFVRSAYSGVGGIGREEVEDRILENIFSRFCIGK